MYGELSRGNLRFPPVCRLIESFYQDDYPASFPRKLCYNTQQINEVYQVKVMIGTNESTSGTSTRE